MNDMELVTDVPVIEMELDVVTRNYPVIPNPEGTPTDDISSMEIDNVIYAVKDEEARTELENKVDKEEGKGLSEEDFTHTLKAKLDGIENGAEVNTVNSVAGKTGNVTLNKSDVGLGNVDNTSDMNKPVSTATQTALNGKVDNSTLNNYYTKTQTDSALSLKADSSSVYTKTETDNLLNGKVDKVEGYDLMSDTDKTKLDGIEAEANKTVVDNLVTSTSTNPVESKAIYNLLNDLLPEATATGNPILITNASGLNAKSLKVELEPIQDLHGYDKPWAGGSGKNKFYEQSAIRDFSSGRYCKWENGKLHFKNDGSGSFHTENVIISLPAGTYTLSAKNYNLVSGGTPLYMFKINDGSLSYPSLTNPYNFTLEAPSTVDIRISTNGTTTASEFYTNIQLESGSSSTDYAPYSNICPISGRTQTTVSVNSEDTAIQFGQTVYGATVKSQGGTDNKWKLLKKKLSDANKVETEGETYKRYRILIESEGIDTAKRTQTLCDKTSFVNSGGEYIHFNINSQGVYIYIYAPNDMATTEEFEFCIPLATPTTINTPAFNIPLNKGSNTLTSDGDMELIYSKEPQ